LNAEGDGEVGFTGAGRAEEHDVAGLDQESAAGEGGDLVADGGLGVEVEVLQRFAGTEPGMPDPQLGAGGVAGRHFPFQDGGQVVLEPPAGIPGLVGQAAGDIQNPWRFECFGEVAELLGRLSGLRGGHHGTSAREPLINVPFVA
jgi:hypothetical protein